MQKIILVLIMLLVPYLEARAECVETPECTELGYDKTSLECPEGGVKCPWNTALMFCGDASVEKTPEQDVQLGYILYSDKTVALNILPDKTPIGIVSDVKNRLAIALEEENGSWANDDGKGYCGSTQTHVPGSDVQYGKLSTMFILEFGKIKQFSYPAAEYCYRYTTEGTKAGDWWLPSIYELFEIFKGEEEVNVSLKRLGKATLRERDSYWSSTEDSYGMIDGGSYSCITNEYAQPSWYNSSGNFTRYSRKEDSKYIRPIMQF